MAFKKIHHLIRYFFFMGIIAFVGYVKNLHEETFLFLTGPCLYLAHGLKSLISPGLIAIPKSEAINYYGFLLPVCLFYYSFFGFQLKQLWNERGNIKWILLVVFLGFVITIHFLAFQKLSGYLSPYF